MYLCNLVELLHVKILLEYISKDIIAQKFLDLQYNDVLPGYQ